MKYQTIIPMSGFGERFRAAGYSVPKPLIPVLGKPIIAHVLDMFPGEKDVYFICNQDHLDSPEYAMRETLNHHCPEGQIIGISPHKLGPVHAVAQAFDKFDPDAPTVVNYCDFTCLWDWAGFKRFVEETNCAGVVVGYTGFHPHMLGSTNYAYVKTDGDKVLAIQEKQPFTSTPMQEFASSGTYYFRSAALMRSMFEQTVKRSDLLLNGEYYVSLAYTPMLEQGMDVRTFAVDTFMQWGTPQDLAEFLYHARIHRKSNTEKAFHTGAVILPMAGLGTRFTKEGFDVPKPLIAVDDEPMFLRARHDLPQAEKTVYILRKDMPGAEQVEDLIANEPNATHVVLPRATEGQACTCLAAMSEIDLDKPVTIGACDNGYLYDASAFQVLMDDPQTDFIVWVQCEYPQGKRKPEMYGWVDTDASGNIRGISVKKPLADPEHDPVVTGAFTFKKGNDFVRAAERMLKRKGRINGEFYVDECINDAVGLGLKGKAFAVQSYICWGTPDELRTYEYWQKASFLCSMYKNF